VRAQRGSGVAMTVMATYWRDGDGTGELNGIKSAAVPPLRT